MSGAALVTVTRDEFFRLIGPRNIHPRSERDRSVWVDQSTHLVVGISTPGYLCDGPAAYQVTRELIAKGVSDGGK